MVIIECDKCLKELKKPGALVFSPPSPEECQGHIVNKMHLCVECWKIIDKIINE